MTTQATPDYNDALADARKATETAQALVAQLERLVNEQRAWIDAQPDWRRVAEARRAELARLIEDTRALVEAHKDTSRQLTAVRDERDMLMSRLGEAHQTLTVADEQG